MNERDAELQGLRVHRREMAFVGGYVTCTNCACNYDAQTNEPTFCQIYSRCVDPKATDKNILMAESCEQWCGNGMDRNQVVHPNHKYRYDGWDT